MRSHARLGRHRHEGGAAAVEFALVMPIVILLLFGILQYSLYFFSGQSGQNAAREAARRASVGDQSCALLRSTALANASLVSGGFSVTRTYHDPTTGTSRASSGIRVGDDVRVTVRYRTLDLNFPFVPVPSTGGIEAQITETSVARLESVTSQTVGCS